MIYQTIANVSFFVTKGAAFRDPFVCSKDIEIFVATIDVCNKYNVWVESLEIREMLTEYDHGSNPYSSWEDEDLDFPTDMDPNTLGVCIEIHEDKRYGVSLWKRETDDEIQGFFDALNAALEKIVPLKFETSAGYPRVEVIVM